MRDTAILWPGHWLAAGTVQPILPLAIRGLRFVAHGVTLIDDLDLTIAPGGPTVIMGYNGAGKSVLLRLLHGLLRPSAGTIEWACGLPPAALRRRQAMVFQHPVLLRRSVADNLRYAMAVAGLDRTAREARLATLLAESALAHLAKRAARVLSGGERQRLAVARALSVEPQVLFLDEPTASLDPVSTQAVEALIARARQRGTKIVLVTQSVGQARRFADDVVFVHRGRVTEHTAAERFFASPASAPAQAFLDGRIEP